MKRTKFILCALIGLFVGTSSLWAVDHVKGNGNLTSKKISIEDFNAIRFDGVIDFNYVQSEAPATIEVTVDQNLHDYVNIEIKDRVLQIGFKGAKVDHFTKFIVKTNSKWLNEVKVSGNGNFMLNREYTGDEMTIKANANSLVQLKNKVTVGKLNLDVSGSANMVANNIEVDKLECDIDGSGSITLKKGTAKEGDFGIVSSGDLHALGIEIPRIECSVTGNGLAELRPTKNLKANIIGKGKIRYKGPTAVERRVIGKGTIEEIH